MSFKVRKFKDYSGDEVSVLVDNKNQPYFWPNVYATTTYRGGSPATAIGVLTTLGMFEIWASSVGLDGSKQIARGEFIDIHQVESLASFLKLTRPAQDQEILISSGVTQKKVTHIGSSRQPKHPIKSKKPSSEKSRFCPKNEAIRRFRWVAKFLIYLRDRGLSRCSSHQERDDLTKKADRIIARLRSLKPRGESFNFMQSESLVGIDKKEIEMIDKILDPASESDLNPFSTPFLKARNYLMWRLFVDTGMRRGELFWLDVDDLNYGTRRVDVRISKTRPRTLGFIEKTAEAFHNFIMKYWSKLPPKTTAHGRLFIREDGKPLELRTINSIFDRLVKAVPGVSEYLEPHTMRRSWNDNFSETIDSMPPEFRPPPEEENAIRNRLMGWSDNSQMAARYAKRHLSKKADAIAEKMANDIVNPGNLSKPSEGANE